MITTDEESGVAPFETILRINASFSLGEDPNITYTGPGDMDLLKMEDEYNYTATASIFGLYYITAEVENEGYNYSDTIAILVMDEAELDMLLKNKWNCIKTALIDGDIEKALTYHNEIERENYERIYSLLENVIQAKARELQDIELVFTEGDRAKYRIRRENDFVGQSVTMTYYIYFSNASNGLWMIERY